MTLHIRGADLRPGDRLAHGTGGYLIDRIEPYTGALNQGEYGPIRTAHNRQGRRITIFDHDLVEVLDRAGETA